MLNWITTQSSMVKSLAYKKESQELYLKFNNDSVYRYEGVPFKVLRDMSNAGSIGKFINQQIKGVYPYVKVD